PFSLPGFGSTNVSILFTPTNAGSFSNAVLFTSTAGNSTNTLLGSAAFEVGPAFSGSPTAGVTPLTVTFNDASTGTITNRAWDFGDGTVSNTTTVTTLVHSYTNAGSYSVSLNIGGPLGSASVLFSNYILVTNPPPNLLLSPTNLDFGLVAIGQSNVLN